MTQLKLIRIRGVFPTVDITSEGSQCDYCRLILPLCTIPGLEALRGLPLKNLSLSGCPLDFDPSLGPLHGMPITDLSLGNTGWVSVDAVGRCFDCLETLPLTHLTILNVNAYLTEVILATRLQNFPLLTQLIVVSCQGVSEAGIVFLKQNLPHIQVMHIKYALDQSLIL